MRRARSPAAAARRAARDGFARSPRSSSGRSHSSASRLRCAGRQPPGGLLRHALHHGRIKDWFDHTLELDENLAPISATVTVTKKVLGCFDEPRVAFQLSYTQGTQGMPRVERLES